MEEEKEKRMEKKPEKSCIDTENLKVDATVKKMIDDLELDINIEAEQSEQNE